LQFRHGSKCGERSREGDLRDEGDHDKKDDYDAHCLFDEMLVQGFSLFLLSPYLFMQLIHHGDYSLLVHALMFNFFVNCSLQLQLAHQDK
jgi:hypothetical protein